MNRPIVIGIASIVPGLGYLMLGKIRQAINVWLGLVICALVYLFTPVEFLWNVAAIGFLGIWFAQLVWAARDAAMERRIASGEVTAAREIQGAVAAPPPGLSRKEKRAFQMRETVKAQIGMEEKLGPVVNVMDRAQASIYTSMYYLGVVDSGLVLVELSLRGQPKSVQRIERGKITRIELKTGMFTDRLRIHLTNQKKPVTYYSQRPFRKQLQMLVSTVDGWKGT